MKKGNNPGVLVIGLDGATWKVLNPLVKKGKIPFFASMIKSGRNGVSLGTIPPLTPSVWTSFLTGVNPGKHRIFGFLNYRANPEKPDFFATRDIAYPTLDKILAKNKKGSYVSFSNLTGLISEAGVETKEVGIDELIKSSQAKVKRLKQATTKKKLSFAFVLFKEVDVAQHLFWGRPELADFFVRLDMVIADLVKLWRAQDPDSAVIFVSDHGFHSSPRLQFSIYPWLAGGRKKGNLLWQIMHSFNYHLKNLGIDYAQLSLLKRVRRILVGKAESQTTRQIVSKRGIQASFEGLYVYDPEIDKKNLVTRLKKLRHLGKKVFQFVSLADDVYQGAFWNGGPDIVWLPSPQFHINISPLAENIFSPHPTDVAGDHTADRQGVYIINSPRLSNKTVFPEALSILDLTATLYDLLGLPKPLGLDGLSPLADYSKLNSKIKKAKVVFTKAYGKFGNNFGVAFTGRKDSTVMVHLLLELIKEKKYKRPSFLFLDHGQHFPESIKFLRKTAKVWNIKMTWKKIDGQNLTATELALAKTEALSSAVTDSGWLGLASAIRRDENPARQKEKFFSPRDTHMRIHPMLDFTEKDIWDYLKRYHIPYNPLYDKGYRSLEEKGTTKVVSDYTKSERAGRDPKKEKIMANLRKLGYF